MGELAEPGPSKSNGGGPREAGKECYALYQYTFYSTLGVGQTHHHILGLSAGGERLTQFICTIHGKCAYSKTSWVNRARYSAL